MRFLFTPVFFFFLLYTSGTHKILIPARLQCDKLVFQCFFFSPSARQLYRLYYSVPIRYTCIGTYTYNTRQNSKRCIYIVGSGPTRNRFVMAILVRFPTVSDAHLFHGFHDNRYRRQQPTCPVATIQRPSRCSSAVLVAY